MKQIDIALGALLLGIPLLHLLAAPYTKVEESFNMQAIHDILVYGVPAPVPEPGQAAARLALAYDHATFAGAVPRTFVGAVMLAGVSQPLVALLGFHRAQLIVRGVLGLANGVALLVLQRALRRAFGRGVAAWWTVLMAGQFHVNFYLTRTLPNMYAFGLTTLATAFLLPQPTPRLASIRQKQAIALLVLAGSIFRAEVAVLLATTSLYLLVSGRTTIRTLAVVGCATLAVGLAVSVPLDSFFWRRWLWPELWGFYFNAVLGSSSEWGVSPWHFYFTSALPRLLLNPMVIVLVGFALAHPATSRSARALVVPNLLFVAIYSLQPHKEARFIFYVVPALTAAAALRADFITTHASKSRIHTATAVVLVVSVLASFAISTGMLVLSSLNYPGGDALQQLYHLAGASPSSLVAPDAGLPIQVHADVLTCMTGLTLFGQNPAGLPLALTTSPASEIATEKHQQQPLLLFDRTENDPKLESLNFWRRFEYALVEDPAVALGDGWQVLGVVSGLNGIEMLRPGVPAAGEKPDSTDEEQASASSGESNALGLGATVAAVRDYVRRWTGGWWLGPRMSPRIRIMKRSTSDI